MIDKSITHDAFFYDMDIEQIRSALTTEINPPSLSELDENEACLSFDYYLWKRTHS